MRDDNRFYPPDYVSAETLAYRLDCSRATIDAYVRDGRLPKPEVIGNLVRWDFVAVRAFIKAHNASKDDSANELAIKNGVLHEPEDPYLKALHNGPPAQR
jgi:predicted DNA-binding transcriptional regulator AlpA